MAEANCTLQPGSSVIHRGAAHVRAGASSAITPLPRAGLSKAEIARTLGVSRRTLYYWIDPGQLDCGLDEGPVRYTPRPLVVCKIDRYREIILVRLSEYPRLSATRLFAEIRASG